MKSNPADAPPLAVLGCFSKDALNPLLRNLVPPGDAEMPRFIFRYATKMSPILRKVTMAVSTHGLATPIACSGARFLYEFERTRGM